MGSKQQPSSPSFTVRRVTLSDFSSMLRPINRRGGDLTTPPIAPLCWRVDPDSADAERSALARLRYSVAMERKRFLEDPDVHQIVATTSDGEIVSFARWNFFPEGYVYERDGRVDVEEFLPEEWRCTMRWELYREMLVGTMKARAEWTPRGKGCWALMSMITRECWRGKGAASMLVQWGVERAREDGVLAYLEASVQGKFLYEKNGFRQVGEVTPWDMRPHGIDVVFNVARMAWWPEEEGKTE